MEILLLFVDRRGQLVTRDEIIERVWGKGVFLDTDNGINAAISKLRQLLRDDPENPVFIQTVKSKGYRFIAAVTETAVADLQQIATSEAEIPAASEAEHKVEAAPFALPPFSPSSLEQQKTVDITAGGSHCSCRSHVRVFPAPPSQSSCHQKGHYRAR